MSTLTLAGRVLAIEDALVEVPHAFGGALGARVLRRAAGNHRHRSQRLRARRALQRCCRTAGRLGAAAEDPAVEAIVRRDGQVRVLWDRTPIDLFFSYDAFHAAAAAARQAVPFGDGIIPILAADHLVVCKVIYNRPRDWVDIDAVLEAAPTSQPPRSCAGWRVSPATKTPATSGSPLF